MTEHIELINHKGLVLRGYGIFPPAAKKAVVFFHGYTGNKTEHNGFFRTMARKLAVEGIASIRFDYANNGESDGEFIDFRFDDAVEDAKRILCYAESLGYEVMVLGYSMGGAIAELVCLEAPITKMVLWSPAGNMYGRLKKRFDEAPKNEKGLMVLPGFVIHPDLVASFNRNDYFRQAKSYSREVLVVHGTKDQAVDYLIGVEYATHFPKSHLYPIEGAGHGYDSEWMQEKLFAVSLEFLKKD